MADLHQQEIDDAEFARRLDAELNRGYGAIPARSIRRGSGDGPNNLNNNGGNDNAARAVRLNMLASVQSDSLTRLNLCLSTTLCLPQITLVTVMLPLYWSEGTGSACNTFAIKVWSIVQASCLLMTLSLRWLRFIKHGNETPLVYHRVFALLSYVQFAWFIIGVYTILLRPGTCKEDAYHLHLLGRILTMILSVQWSLPCLCFMCLLPVVFCCLPCVLRILQWIQREEQIQRGQHIIKQLPSFNYRPGMFRDLEGGGSDPECVICSENYLAGEPLRMLRCHPTHHFHQRCIDQWIQVKSTCPICRKDISPDADRDEGEEEDAPLLQEVIVS